MWVIRLILRNAGRHRLRTLLTILGLAVASVAFCVIRTMISSYYSSVDVLPPNRLVTRNAVSLIFSLPVAYKQKIEMVPGVEEVAYANWFGGLYNNDAKNFFPSFAIGPNDCIDMYVEFVLSPDEKAQFLQEKNAAVAGRVTAERFGWKIGDHIRLTGQIFPGDFDFILRGIYVGRETGVDETSFIFHWDFLDETMRQRVPEMAGEVGWYLVRVTDPAQSATISAAIDEIFKNSRAETLTETEKAFTLNFLAQMDSIIFGLRIVSYLIIAVIFMVLVNTMAMSARERISEYAVLKTLGFRGFHLIGLILGESLVIALGGGGLGILLTFPVLRSLEQLMRSFFPGLHINATTLGLISLFIALVGILASVFPIYRAVRISIIDGLRNVG